MVVHSFKNFPINNVSVGLNIFSKYIEKTIVETTDCALYVYFSGQLSNDDESKIIEFGWVKLDIDVWSILI